MALAQSSIIEPIKKPFEPVDWATVKEIRRLHSELRYTVTRLGEMYGYSPGKISYIINKQQRPDTVRFHRSQGQLGCKKPRDKLKADLWCHLAVIAIRHNTAHRGLHPLEIVSALKAQFPSPLTRAERDILDEVCAKYGYSFDNIPAGRKL